jgi:hypothetical protein
MVARHRLRAAGALSAIVAVAGTISTAPTARAQTAPQPLVGTFRIAAGTCSRGPVSGSTFRMVVPSGGPGGPYVSNNDSTCGDHTYTLLAPGSDGGLVAGSYQPEPSPAFDGSGNSLAARITQPTRFYGIAFSTSTNAVDPQTGVHVGSPSVDVQNGKLTGDLRAFAASWNRQQFNQGAPKPDGSKPGNTATPTGTYNAATGAFTIDWASQIQGGPFNNFTGYWHLVGTFVAARGGSATTVAPAQPAPGAPSAPASPIGGTASGTDGNGTATTMAPAAGNAPTPTSPAQAAPGTTVTTVTGAVPPAHSQVATSRTAHHGSNTAPLAVVAALLIALAVGGGWYTLRRRGAAT